MRIMPATIAIVLAAPAAANDVIYETTINVADSFAIPTSTATLRDGFLLRWTLLDAGDRVQFLQLPLDSNTPSDGRATATSTSGPGFDFAAAMLTDGLIDDDPNFFGLLTQFVSTSGQFVGTDVMPASERDLLGLDPQLTSPPFEGFEITAFRAIVNSQSISVSTVGEDSVIDYQYSLQFQIFGEVPAPGTALPLAALGIAATRRRR